MAGEFHQASGRRLQEWEFHHTELRLEYGGGALVFVDRDQWDEVQFVSSGRVSLCEISSASPALVSVHCYPRSSSFHFLNSVSKNVAFLFTFIHESFPKNRREKLWVPFFNCMHEAFPFRHWSSRRGRIDGAVSRSSVSRSSAGFLEVAVEGGRIPLPLALHWVS